MCIEKVSNVVSTSICTPIFLSSDLGDQPERVYHPDRLFAAFANSHTEAAAAAALTADASAAASSAAAAAAAEEQQHEDATIRTEIERRFFRLLCELNAADKLPAIVFNFEHVFCDHLARVTLETLEKLEKWQKFAELDPAVLKRNQKALDQAKKELDRGRDKEKNEKKEEEQQRMDAEAGGGGNQEDLLRVCFTVLLLLMFIFSSVASHCGWGFAFR